MKDESPVDAVRRVLKREFDIESKNIQVMMLIEAVRDASPPPQEFTIASLRAVLRTMEPHICLEAWATRCSRDLVAWLSKQAQVHKLAVAVGDERLWCVLEGTLAGMLLRVTQGRDLEP